MTIKVKPKPKQKRKEVSLQTTFNRVVRHLRRQRKQCIEKGTCLYRSTKGNLMCAAGCLIPKKLYSPEMEGQVVINHRDLFENKLGYNINLVSDLQGVHDYYSVRQWEKQLKIVAERWGLKYRLTSKVKQSN